MSSEHPPRRTSPSPAEAVTQPPAAVGSPPPLPTTTDGPVVAESATLAPAAAPVAPAERVTPPDYEILSELGRGGMGVVYKARHRALKRTVALKMILSGGHAGEHDLARFLAEAEAVAHLQHPNIVPLYEFGQHAGLPFFTLEFVSGGTLADRLSEGCLQPRDAARLVEQIARGMHYAHERGIVHRDLKPANVLLAKDGTPKITDFGLAKRIAVRAGVTATGAVMGTPAYMAPEQANGRTKDVGPAADVYALGAVLYECLTGRPPFQARTSLDILMQVASEEPVPPRQRRPRVPRDLDTICLKCLQKNPRWRYASAEALADDLRRHLNHEPILARRTGLWERTVKFAQRQPLLATALVFVSVGILLGLAQTAWSFRHTPFNPADYQPPTPAPPADKNPRIVGPAVPRSPFFRRVLPAQGRRVWCLAFSPDGSTLAAGDDGLVRRWHDPLAGSPQLVPLLKGHDDSIHALAFAPDGSGFATGSADRTVKVWDATGTVKHTLRGHQRRVLAVAFGPDGHVLATAGDDEVVKLWDPATGAALRELRGHADSVYGLAFSRDGRLLVSGSHDGTAILWDPATGKVRHALRGHTGAVRAVALSPDGQTVASGGEDGVVCLWSAADGARAGRLEAGRPAEPPRINGLAFSPDGRLLVVAEAGRVRAWDLAKRQPLPDRAFPGAPEKVSCMAVSPDGKAVAFADGDGRVWVEGPLGDDADQPPAGP